MPKRRGPVTRSSKNEEEEEPEKPKKPVKEKKVDKKDEKETKKKRSSTRVTRSSSSKTAECVIKEVKKPVKKVAPVVMVEDPMAMIMMVESSLAKSGSNSQINYDEDSSASNSKILLSNESSESPYFSCQPSTSKDTFMTYGDEEMSDDKSETSIESSTGDWEEVKDADVSSDDSDLDNYHPELPSEGIEIDLEKPCHNRRQEKKKNAREDYLRQKANKRKIAIQINLHKSHFLALLATGRFINRITFSNDLIQSLSLSHVSFLKESIDITIINRRLIQDYLNWFNGNFTLEFKPPVGKVSLKNLQNYPNVTETLSNCLESKSAKSCVDYLLSFISILRSIRSSENKKIQVRLCYAMTPIPVKTKDLILSEKQKKHRKQLPEPKSDEKKNGKRPKKSRKMVSSGDEDDVETCVEKKSPSKSPKKNNSGITPIEHWAEIFIVTDGKWVCVEPINKILDEPLKIGEELASQPFVYVISFDDYNHVKDVTCRYSSKFMNAAFQRLRVDKEWLKETLDHLRPGYKTKQDDEEDMQLDTQLSLQPLPKTIGEYKSHPLYALKRHLLQYEAIYPSDAATVGFFRNEPVYPRSCIKNVRSKEYWKRQARVIRDNETPYKFINGRKKWDRFAEKYITDVQKELFGYWQTEDYIPPVAMNGKVPRNEFGNVELFQPCMRPIGTVHLRLPGLLRVANKLNIDCVPAVIGFDNARCGIIPVYDGFIVCQEHEDILIAAYEEEEQNLIKKQQDRIKNRALENWRQLTRGLLIREKLRKKYEDDE